MTEIDNYALLFGAHAVAAAHAYPNGPPLLGREARHRMLAVLDSGLSSERQPAGEGPPPDHPAAFAAAYGEEYARVRPIYRRLTARPLPARAYRRLTHRLLAEPKIVRALTHLKSLSPRQVAVVEALPPELIRRSFLALKPRVNDAKDLARIFDVAEQSGRSRAALAETLLRCRESGEVRERLRRALTPRRLAVVPWAGDDLLRPVGDVSDVKKLAHEFRNCMANFVEQWAFAQNMVIYRYDGESPAVCTIERDMHFGWRIDEIKGLKNAALRPGVHRDIVARFAAAGIRDGAPMQALLRAW